VVWKHGGIRHPKVRTVREAPVFQFLVAKRTGDVQHVARNHGRTCILRRDSRTLQSQVAKERPTGKASCKGTGSFQIKRIVLFVQTPNRGLLGRVENSDRRGCEADATGLYIDECMRPRRYACDSPRIEGNDVVVLAEQLTKGVTRPHHTLDLSEMYSQLAKDGRDLRLLLLARLNVQVSLTPQRAMRKIYQS
jgi:hypothetical protein